MSAEVGSQPESDFCPYSWLTLESRLTGRTKVYKLYGSRKVWVATFSKAFDAVRFLQRAA